ncbi:MAG: cupin domain-containing protein, partial [Chloroflexi bacterium]|nr:cupin domain-containing protein [Chloroflexota bacterium]
MTQQAEAPEALAPTRPLEGMGARKFPYDYWLEAQNCPVHRGYYIEDLRQIELGDWKLRGMKTAFVQLMGMEGINELRVSELAPGETTEPFKFGLDEIVYVLEGVGTTTVWSDAGGPKRSFEWGPRSMFFLPRHYTHQFTNMQGGQRVRLMHYNYLALVLSGCDTPEFFFNNPYTAAPMPVENVFAEAKSYENPAGRGRRSVWYGNFFPDMQAWDKLEPFWGRGAGGHV